MMYEHDFEHLFDDMLKDTTTWFTYRDIDREAIKILKDRYRKEHNITNQELDSLLSYDPDITGDPKDFFIAKYSYEEVSKVYREVEQQMREDILNQLKFEQQFKDLRHIGDLKKAQRQLDGTFAVKMQENTREISDTGKNINENIRSIDPRDIIHTYISLASMYNIQDDMNLRDIIEKSINNPQHGVLIDEFSSLITDDNNRDSFKKIFKDSKEKMETFDIALSLAQKDADCRTKIVKDKTDLLEYFATKFPGLMDYYHTSAINKLDAAIERTKQGIVEAPPITETIKPYDALENALRSGVTTKDIIRIEKQHTNDEREEGEQTHDEREVC